MQHSDGVTHGVWNGYTRHHMVCGGGPLWPRESISAFACMRDKPGQQHVAKPSGPQCSSRWYLVRTVPRRREPGMQAPQMGMQMQNSKQFLQHPSPSNCSRIWPYSTHGQIMAFRQLMPGQSGKQHRPHLQMGTFHATGAPAPAGPAGRFA